MCLKIKRLMRNIGDCVYSCGPMMPTIIILLTLGFLYAHLEEKTFFYIAFGLFTFLLGLFNFYLNKTKLNLELFEKRFEIYNDCRQALIIVLQKGTIDFHDAVKLLSSNRDKVRLLFGKEIVSY